MIIVDQYGRAIEPGDEVVLVKQDHSPFTVVKCGDLLEETPAGPRRMLAMNQTRIMGFPENVVVAPVFIVKKADKTASSLLS